MNSCPWGEIRGQVPAASVLNIFISDQYLTLFYVCFCLKTPYLIYTVDSWSSCWNEAHLTLHLAHHRLLVCRKWESPSALCWGAILNSKTTNTRDKNLKNLAAKGIRDTCSRDEKSELGIWLRWPLFHHSAGQGTIRIAPRKLDSGLQINVSE